MNKSAFARELAGRLRVRVSRQMVDKYRVRGMPLNSVDSALQWLADNSVGDAGRRAAEVIKRDAVRTVIWQPPGAPLQPADCGREPDEFLAEEGPKFHDARYADADFMWLSGWLEQRVPELAKLTPQTAEMVRRAIRSVICGWSCGMACRHCRRAAGIVEPPEPDDELEGRAA